MQPFRGVDLKRIVLAPQRTPREDFRLLFAELYADGVVLRWVEIGGRSPFEWDEDPPLLRRLANRLRSRPSTAGSTHGDEVAAAVAVGLPGPAGIELTDDVGTTYEPQGGGSHGGEDVMRGEFQFIPEVPAAARVLIVNGLDWSVELRLDESADALAR